METSAMRPETMSVSAAAACLKPTASVLCHPRRKPRPRSPEEIAAAMVAIAPEEQVVAAEAEAPRPSVAQLADVSKPQGKVEPASSTTPPSADDADPETDVPSDDEVREKIAQEVKKPGEAEEGVDRSYATSPQTIAPVVQKVAVREKKRPRWPVEEGESSDEEEDYCMYYKRMFRLREAGEDEQKEMLIAEIRKRRTPASRRLRREEDNLKKRRKAQDYAPFHTAKALEKARMVLETDQMEEDLLAMFEVEPGHFDDPSELAKEAANKSHKKKKVDERANNDVEIVKRQQTLPKVAKSGKGKAAATRSKVAAGKKGGNGKLGISKKKGGGHGLFGGNVGKDFTKHDAKKGWVVCNFCETEVWPPNQNKHAAACRAKSG